MLQCGAVCCSWLQCVAVCFRGGVTVSYPTHTRTMTHIQKRGGGGFDLSHLPVTCKIRDFVTATHCDMLQHTKIHCNKLQRTATQDEAFYKPWPLEHSVTHVTCCSTLQHTRIYCITLQHSSTREEVSYGVT